MSILSGLTSDKRVKTSISSHINLVPNLLSVWGRDEKNVLFFSTISMDTQKNHDPKIGLLYNSA